MNAQITNMVFSLGAMQLARKVPTEDPEVLFYLRILYVGIQAATLALYFYISTKIKAKNDTKVLKYVAPASPLSQTEPETITTTNRDYDLGEIAKLQKSVYFGVAIMCFLHFYLKYTQPLFIQSIMAAKGIYDAKPVKIHLFGQPATGDLQRPFATAPGMMDMLKDATGGGEAAAPAASIKAKETKKTK